ncbi:MAG: hypothetical protein A2653_00800 [Candidatus Zambryskibacteria bacterium RIFCSPHIGHO2_01_FULL_43_25]|uniref:DUF1761 domain-containing protein n=1 Tax=Candidatus Zambryskibacteria bacterium RIFCSPLOWO2_01_FULL_45_21 TaxID=1802761 RepID=A0A1G2U6B0_9BACT|nr:MAG: hypothetical protein A2653_00800 [Candidatus Zambryskibacteria bacterium RIFCSPHIGHO2_01_FULL_43_25]OHB00589.1 MAG: hypothetical protein A3E94_00410 [Candidatus Zambryskibacteria bacterium RIFCSPHIGHO2_12_FULL_44_12b]OHB04442.1 MAG: hypothetical protein A3B14_03325 [Candidatus Zambryskibacteria bacterium RIFCSPLOWO2_01_FULL_45_21]
MANFWIILVAAIVSMASGALWYSPAAFGNLWMKLSGITAETMEKAKSKGMKKPYTVSFIFEIVAVYVLAYFVFLINIETVSQVLSLVFFAWLGFVVPIFVSQTIWEQKPFKLFLLNSLQRLVALALAGIILVLLS